jgi:hypothetical protein
VFACRAIKRGKYKEKIMCYYIYKRKESGAVFQLSWAFTKEELNAKLEKYSFWKQNGWDVFFIER